MTLPSAVFGAGGSAMWSSTPQDANWVPTSGDTNWSTGANDFPGNTTGTTNSDLATFNNASSQLTITTAASLNIDNISFDTAAGNYTIGSVGGSSLLLTSAGEIQILSTLTSTNAVETVNAPLIIEGAGGTYTFANNSANGTGADDGTLDFGGGITGGASGATVLTLTGSNTNANTIAGIIGNGSATSLAVTKSGAGTWVLTGANIYTGTTTLTGGTLQLSGGNNRLLNTGSVSFTGSSTLNIGSTSQTLASLAMSNGVTGTVNGSSGTLTITGSSFAVGGTGSGTSQTLNMSGLTTFNYNNSSGTLEVDGSNNGVSAGSSGTVTLAATNTITASSFGVGGLFESNNTSVDTGTVNLGTTNTINADTITICTSRSEGTLEYPTGTSNPTLNIYGSNGTGRAANFYVGYAGAPAVSGSQQGTVDLTSNVTGTSTLNALVGNLTIGSDIRASPAGSNSVITAGTFLMGAGTLDATSITIGQNLTGLSGAGGSTSTTGTLTVGGGTVKVGTLYLGDQQVSGTTAPITATFNLNSGATLEATTIANGTGTGTAAGVVRTFNWNSGTIENYLGNSALSETETNLTISAGPTWTLASTGTHAFDIDSGFTGTVSAVLAGTGGTLVDAGPGTLILAAANTYTGSTTVSAGTLQIGNGTAGSISSSSALVMAGGTFGLLGKTSGTTSQTVASLSLNADTASAISLNPNTAAGGTGTTLTITSGTLTTGAGAALNFNYAAGTTNGSTVGNDIVVFGTSPTLASGIIGGGYTVTDTGGTGFATVNGSKQVVRLADNGTSGLPVSGGSSTTNYFIDSTYSTTNTGAAGSLVEALSSNVSANTVTINTTNLSSGANLALGTNALTITSGGGFAFAGANPYTISATGAGGITTSSAGGALIFNNFNSSSTGVTMSAPILANGTNAVTFTGAGVTILQGASTYTGGTTIGSGTVRANSGTTSLGTGALTINSGGTLGGNGSVGNATNALTVNAGGTIAAGSSSTTTGTLTTGNETWNAGGAYSWKAASLLGPSSTTNAARGTGASGTTGQTNSWDDVAMSALSVSSLGGSNSSFTINISDTSTLSPPTYNTYSWIIAQSTAAVTPPTGYNVFVNSGTANSNLLVAGGSGGSAAFALNTSGFAESGSGATTALSAFTLELVSNGSGGDNLVLDYTSAPEPGTAMLVLSGALPILLRRRRRTGKK